MSDPQVKIETLCGVHRRSGHLVVLREDDRVVLDARTDECCMIAMESTAMTLLFDVFGEWLE